MNSKHKLKAKDFVRFADAESRLFRDLAFVVCSTGVLPEKELYECWQMAEVVHREFPDARRIADMAAGHGLLGWMLVLLSHYESGRVSRTAVTIDIKKSNAALILSDAFKKRWPELTDSVHFVECRIDSVTSTEGSSTLFVATHACGALSDQVILSAVASGSSVALMPCCHSLRNQSHTLANLSEISNVSCEEIEPNPSSIDQFRVQALNALGYSVSVDSISPEISPYHSIILAKTLPQRILPLIKQTESIPQKLKAEGEIQAFERIQSFDVSNLEDARCLSVRPSSEWVRSFDLCFWIENEADGQSLRSVIIETAKSSEFEVEVKVKDRYLRPADNKLSMTFQVTMKSALRSISKVDSQNLHSALCRTLKERYQMRA